MPKGTGLQSPYDDYAAPMPDASGNWAATRSTDVSGPGGPGLQTSPFTEAVVPTPSGSETPNSSGVPALPATFSVPSTVPATVEPKDLKDVNKSVD